MWGQESNPAHERPEEVDVEHKIICRAKVSDSCFDGRPTRKQFGEDEPLSEDGTFDGESIVCDPCYVMLMPLTPSGVGLNHELAAAIEKARAGR